MVGVYTVKRTVHLLLFFWITLLFMSPLVGILSILTLCNFAIILNFNERLSETD